jgi:pimeloyl-ACP methyl ester carboxylesterase
MAILLLIATTSVLTSTGASAQDAEPEYFLDPETLPFEPLEGAENGWGEYRGAGYRYELPADPDDFNGELVMWTHGFRGEGLELTVDGPPEALRQWLIDNGYAWGASSYTKNSYNVRDGVTSTKRVAKAIKRRHVGFTDQVYVTGASMGGHIAAASIERYPWFYKGAMPVCGVVGDYELFDYFLDYNLGAQERRAVQEPGRDRIGWRTPELRRSVRVLERVPECRQLHVRTRSWRRHDCRWAVPGHREHRHGLPA